MAMDFLSFSESYIIRTSNEILRRRAFVAARLNSQYKMPKGSVQLLVTEARKLGLLRPTRFNLLSDAAAYRAAFRFYRGNAKQRAAVESQVMKSRTYTIPLQCLIRDGFKTWNDIKRAAAARQSKDRAQAAAPTAAEQMPKALTAAEQPGQPAAQEASLTAGGVLEFLKELIARLQSERDDAANAQTQLLVGIDQIRKRAEELVKDLARVRRENHELAILRLEELSESLGSPTLFRAVEQYKLEAEERKLSGRTLIGLPQTARFYKNAPIRYGNGFEQEYALLSPPDQEALGRAVESLANNGPRYHGLYTRKPKQALHNLPRGVRVSRAQRELRFAWSYTDNVLTLHTVWRRGDKRYYTSEA